jgi:tRNA 2-(methylsulfanyl)-N6-isopentenyladenosine37 hydroxylase
MLNLLRPTDPSWVEAARADLRGLLSDHAHCEIKAAQSALSLVARFGGEHPELVDPLSSLAREETAHFREVQDHLGQRGGALGKPPVDDYVRALREAAHRERGEAPPFLDRLLVCALIEARSCERFKLLADRIGDEALTPFYAGLMVAEARHYRLFAELGERIFGAAVSRARLAHLAELEAEIADRLPLGPTVHG